MSPIIRCSRDVSNTTLFVDPAIGFRCEVISATGPLIRDQVVTGYLLIVLQRGTAHIETDGDRTYDLSAAEGLVLPMGMRWRWSQTGSTIFYTVQLGAPTAGIAAGAEPVFIRPSEITDLSPTPPPNAALLLGPTPFQTGKRLFSDPTQQWKVGLWTSSAYYRKTTPFPKHEFMYLLTGSLELRPENGPVQSFAAGESVLIPKDTVCDWKTEGMSKIYCVFEPKGS